MLVLRSVSVGSVSYWRREAVYTTWLGGGALELGLAGEVSPAMLRHALLGLGPGGEPLTPRPERRLRHGWDMVLAAPKSVSVLVATLSPSSAEVIVEAFRGAVADTVRLLEENAGRLRRGGQEIPGRVVVGSFEHRESGSGDPHLHNHAVLANLGFDGGARWGCLVSGPLWRWREGLAAGFQLALRHRLREAGLDLDWELSVGGLGEISAVPKDVLREASRRSFAVMARSRSFGSLSAGAARAAQGMTRVGSRTSGHRPVDWGVDEAERIIAGRRVGVIAPSPPPEARLVSEALAGRSSAFSRADVLVALAETHAHLELRSAMAWASVWCQANLSVRHGHWTTPLATALDTHVVDRAFEARFAHVAKVDRGAAEQEMTSLGVDAEVARAATRLACGGEGIAVLPRAPWLAQAACVDAARAAWQAAGVAVEVSCPSDLDARRWRALSSLRPPGGAVVGLGGRRLQARGAGGRVLVVDAADHLSPRALADLVDRASASGTKLVLVIGGTHLGQGPCLAASLERLQDELVPAALRDLPSPELPGMAGARRPVNPSVTPPGGGAVHACFTGTDAMAHLVRAWATSGGGGGQVGPHGVLMVAFGPGEVEVLNLAARAHLIESGALAARGQVRLGSRDYGLGEQVVALRRMGAVKSATWGTVVALGPSSVTVEWRGGTGKPCSTVRSEHAASLAYGYATTVPYLRGLDDARTGPSPKLMVLGDPLELGRRSAHVSRALVTTPSPGPLARPRTEARREMAAIELAVGWPDEAILERAGPRPLGPTGRARWEGIVARLAQGRLAGLAEDRATGIELSPRSGLQLGHLRRDRGAQVPGPSL
jgi:conjugative relaxase-like TrwC/TraI family protein